MNISILVFYYGENKPTLLEVPKVYTIFNLRYKISLDKNVNIANVLIFNSKIDEYPNESKMKLNDQTILKQSSNYYIYLIPETDNNNNDYDNNYCSSNYSIGDIDDEQKSDFFNQSLSKSIPINNISERSSLFKKSMKNLKNEYMKLTFRYNSEDYSFFQFINDTKFSIFEPKIRRIFKIDDEVTFYLEGGNKNEKINDKKIKDYMGQDPIIIIRPEEHRESIFYYKIFGNNKIFDSKAHNIKELKDNIEEKNISIEGIFFGGKLLSDSISLDSFCSSSKSDYFYLTVYPKQSICDFSKTISFGNSD